MPLAYPAEQVCHLRGTGTDRHVNGPLPVEKEASVYIGVGTLILIIILILLLT